MENCSLECIQGALNATDQEFLDKPEWKEMFKDFIKGKGEAEIKALKIIDQYEFAKMIFEKEKIEDEDMAKFVNLFETKTKKLDEAKQKRSVKSFFEKLMIDAAKSFKEAPIYKEFENMLIKKVEKNQNK